MSITFRGAVAKTWTNTATTYGGLGLVGVVGRGSSAGGNLVLLDGTAVKFNITIPVTTFGGFMLANPVPFTNLITTITNAAGYSIIAVTN